MKHKEGLLITSGLVFGAATAITGGLIKMRSNVRGQRQEQRTAIEERDRNYKEAARAEELSRGDIDAKAEGLALGGAVVDIRTFPTYRDGDPYVPFAVFIGAVKRAEDE